jgi:hypothetical protein
MRGRALRSQPETVKRKTPENNSDGGDTKAIILQIEHPVADFDSWKRAFDSDPVGRVRSGVRRYRVSRPVDDPNYVLIDLEFETTGEAEGLLAAMRQVWSRAGHSVSSNQRARITEAVETKEIGSDLMHERLT